MKEAETNEDAMGRRMTKKAENSGCTTRADVDEWSNAKIYVPKRNISRSCPLPENPKTKKGRFHA